ncbi:MAG: DUF4214 domain-containing protein [Clostridiales bacterium]|nr:DUF4214 domain-containing protein [Clostridiales bacterium]
MNADLDERIEFKRNAVLGMDSLDVDNDNLLQFFDLYCDFHKKKAELSDVDIVINKALDGVMRRVVDVNMLYKYDGEKFVKMTYLSLFGRIPGLLEKEELLCDMKFDLRAKQDIIFSLASSEEGRFRNVSLSGFDSVDAKDILKYDDREFIRVAYLLIFGRQADLEGEEQFLRVLRSKERNKPETLKILSESEEAQKIGLKINGLEEAILNEPREKKIYSVPVLGKILNFFKGLKNNNRQIRALKAEDTKLFDMMQSKLATANDNIRELKLNNELLNAEIRRNGSETARLKKEVDELRSQIELLKKESR